MIAAVTVTLVTVLIVVGIAAGLVFIFRGIRRR